MKKSRKIMAITFLGVILTLAFAPMVLAAEEGGGELSSMAKGIIGAAGGLCISLAALAGTLAQGKSIAAGLEGIARNPGASGKIQTPMIIGLAFQESLVLYALVVAFMLILKV
jgi:F-type H+-transporting ATPase subunit c